MAPSASSLRSMTNAMHMSKDETVRIAALKAIPRYRWAGKERYGLSQSDTCVLCLETYATDDVLRMLPCKHYYHVECIDQWLLVSQRGAVQRYCPLCKADPIPLVAKLPTPAQNAARVGIPEVLENLPADPDVRHTFVHVAAESSPVRSPALSSRIASAASSAAASVFAVSRALQSNCRVAPRLQQGAGLQPHNGPHDPSTPPAIDTPSPSASQPGSPAVLSSPSYSDSPPTPRVHQHTRDQAIIVSDADE